MMLSPVRMMVTPLILAGACAVLAPPVAGQEPIPILPRQDGYDWSRWLIGEWDGWTEDDEGRRIRMTQSFECEVECRFLLTRIKQEVAPGQWYQGSGLFRYDPASEESTGEWFGILGDRNIGLGRRDGERWQWDLHRWGRPRVNRVRERMGPDEYRVISTSVGPNGKARVTREVMQRVPGAPPSDPIDTQQGSWTMPARYRDVQLASLETQRALLHAMADSMPEALYGDADNPGQRSFAQHVYHAAVAYAQAVDRYVDGPSFEVPDAAAAETSRASLKAIVDRGFDYSRRLFEEQSDAARQESIRFAGRSFPAWQLWDELNEHTYWTLGEIVGNFRSNGMTPPAFRFF